MLVGYRGGGEKRSGSGCILKAATLPGLPGGLDRGCERAKVWFEQRRMELPLTEMAKPWVQVGNS